MPQLYRMILSQSYADWRGEGAAGAKSSPIQHMHSLASQPKRPRRLQSGKRRDYIGSMNTLIVWHDGGCPLCQREIALMRRLDRGGRIAFIDVASPGNACPIDRAALLARFHAREDGVLLSGAAAFAAMWRAIPLLRPLRLAARNPRILGLLESAYRIFLRLRPRLQRAALWGERRAS
jgi:predicted DCC family thiol-disulfide oxidoreductase YuxK